MKGYKSAKMAEVMARRRNEVGLTGPGQECGPVQLPDGSWGYWTAHNVYRGEPYGKVLLPKGKFISGEQWKMYVAGVYSWKVVLMK